MRRLPLTQESEKDCLSYRKGEIYLKKRAGVVRPANYSMMIGGDKDECFAINKPIG
jgi:hypothetical protein